MRIVLYTVAGDVFVLANIAPESIVAEVKFRVCSECQLSPWYPKLLMGEQELKDDERLDMHMTDNLDELEILMVLIVDLKQCISFAKLAEETGRYDDMFEYMKLAALNSQELSYTERYLLARAFKNVLGRLRRVLREHQEGTNAITGATNLALAWIRKVENEFKHTCSTLFELLDDRLLAMASNNEAKAFFHNMKADCNRYMAEVKDVAAEKATVVENAQVAYAEATLETSELAASNPIRLGVALSYSVFQHDILGNGKEALNIARNAFEDSIADIDWVCDGSTPSEKSYDRTLIMQLLRDNVVLWSEEP